MKLTFNQQNFPEEGVETHSGRLIIVDGNQDIQSVEIDYGTIEGQRLQSQFHLALKIHDALEGCDRLEILASAPSRQDVLDRVRAGITVNSVDLWFDALPRNSTLRKNFKVEGLFL